MPDTELAKWKLVEDLEYTVNVEKIGIIPHIMLNIVRLIELHKYDQYLE